MWLLRLESSNHVIGLLFISSVKQGIFEKCHTAMESLVDHMLDLLPSLCFTALDRSEAITHMSQAELFRFVLNTYDG